MSKYGSMRRPASKISTKKQIASVQRSFVRGVLILFLATLMIIFVFGDHGLRRTYNFAPENDLFLYVTDNHSVYGMIAFNNSSCSTSKFSFYTGEGYLTPNRILASIFRCLIQNKQQFDQLMSFSEPFKFSRFLYE